MENSSNNPSTSAELKEERLIQKVDLDDNETPRIENFAPAPDPVKQQRLNEKPPKKPLEVIPELQMVQSVKIQPSVGTRLDMQYVHEVNLEEGQPRPKYTFKMTKKQQKFFEKNRANTSKGFCQYETITIPEPIPTKKVQLKAEIPSPEASSAKVAPRRVTPTSSWLYPYPQSSEELALKKPKSGIFINETDQQEPTKDYDSFDLVFARKPRPDADLGPKKKKRSKSGGDALEVIDEEGDGGKKKKKKKRSKRTKDSPEEGH